MLPTALLLWVLPCLTGWAHASITVYQKPFATTTAQSGNYTGPAAFNPTVLQAPAIPNPAPPTQFTLQLQQTAQAVQGLSIPIAGTFFGFSIEMSVVDQVIGLNASFIQPAFLNLMANIKQRAGACFVRVGGNTQEVAVLVDSLPGGLMIVKDKAASSNPTETPTLLYTTEMIYMLSNVSALVNTKWYLGVPFNDTSNLRLGIAHAGIAILGDNLLGLQVSNEPDLYAGHQHRQSTYSPFDYFGEFGVFVQAMNNDPDFPVRDKLIAPSVATGSWTPEMVWDTNFIPTYTNNLGYLAVEHYPDDNCFAQFGLGTPRDPQTEFSNFLNHTAGKALIQPYLNSSQIAQASGKPFLMFETNTASCGGFPGLSDSFGSALWALDYGLQMAFSNFSGAMLHVGGKSDFYNPFTPPPTNESLLHQWTIGPIYYSALISAEVFGTSNTSKIIDLNANNGNIFTPAYAIYEKDSVAKVALFNFMTDPSGANTYTATIAVGGGDSGANATPSSVKVKYFVADSVADKGDNIFWAGQSFGGTFKSDGRLKGDLNVTTINCDTNANTCQIPVPAPAFALVFLNDDAYGEVTPSKPETFSTSKYTKTENTATVDPSILATSNGHGAGSLNLGSTSRGSANAAAATRYSAAVALMAAFAGAWLIGRSLAR